MSLGNAKQYGSVSDVSIRLEEFSRACNVLGVTEGRIEWVDDQKHLRLDHEPQIDLIRLIEEESTVSLRAVRPDLVLLPIAGALNQDHVAVHQAGFIASRCHLSSFKHSPGAVLGYSLPEETWTTRPEQHSFYVDITDVVETKASALKHYGSQLRPTGHPRSLDNITVQDLEMGGRVGVKAAESFVPYKMLL